MSASGTRAISRIVLGVLIVTVLLLGYSASQSSLSTSCSPGDGAALDLETDVGNSQFAHIYMHGELLQKLASNTRIPLIKGHIGYTNGSLNICTKLPDCISTTGELKILSYWPGTALLGLLQWTEPKSGLMRKKIIFAPYKENDLMCG